MDANEKIKLLEQIPINSNWQGLTLASLVRNKSPFYVPIVSSSLYSEFCEGVRWIDLVGNTKDIDNSYELEGIRIIPIYINPRVSKDSTISLRSTHVLNPSINRKIIIPSTNVFANQKKDSIPKSKSSQTKPKRFFFNGFDFDIAKITHDIKRMNDDQLYDLKLTIVKSLYLLLRVDYIVTDTNNWCTESNDGKGIKYAEVLERIASYIIKNKLPTKFLVISEILTELKRLSKRYPPARIAQSMLMNSFMPRNLIFIPNPNDDIPADVIADPCIQRQVVKLYREGKHISVVSNDQQAMMLFSAAVSNDSIAGRPTPNFLSLENINQLFILLNKLSK